MQVFHARAASPETRTQLGAHLSRAQARRNRTQAESAKGGQGRKPGRPGRVAAPDGGCMIPSRRMAPDAASALKNSRRTSALEASA
jgi:hypothetical protein